MTHVVAIKCHNVWLEILSNVIVIETAACYGYRNCHTLWLGKMSNVMDHAKRYCYRNCHSLWLRIMSRGGYVDIFTVCRYR